MSPRPAPAHPDISTTARRWAAVGAVIFCIIIVGLAFVIMAEEFGEAFEEAEEALDFLANLAGLLAVSFIFLEMMTGSFRPLLRRAFEGNTLRGAHVAFGLTGLGFALTHFGLLLPHIGEHWEEANKILFIFGPVILGLLIITILTALNRNRLQKTWNWLHLLNYVLFAGAIFHGLVVGPEGGDVPMRVIFSLFLAGALAGLAYRASSSDWRARFVGGK